MKYNRVTTGRATIIACGEACRAESSVQCVHLNSAHGACVDAAGVSFADAADIWVWVRFSDLGVGATESETMLCAREEGFVGRAESTPNDRGCSRPRPRPLPPTPEIDNPGSLGRVTDRPERVSRSPMPPSVELWRAAAAAAAVTAAWKGVGQEHGSGCRAVALWGRPGPL